MEGEGWLPVVLSHHKLSDVYTKWNVLQTHEEVQGIVGGLDGSLASRDGAIYANIVKHADNDRKRVTRFQG